MLLHLNSCLILFIRKGQTAEIILFRENQNQNLEDILIVMLTRYFVSKNERFFEQRITPVEFEREIFSFS